VANVCRFATVLDKTIAALSFSEVVLSFTEGEL
jgi:hypothetical protein